MIAETHPLIEHITIAVTSFVTGGGLVRLFHYISTAMPPLPKEAGWFTTFLYNLMKGVTGHDPTTNLAKS